MSLGPRIVREIGSLDGPLKGKEKGGGTVGVLQGSQDFVGTGDEPESRHNPFYYCSDTKMNMRTVIPEVDRDPTPVSYGLMSTRAKPVTPKRVNPSR